MRKIIVIISLLFAGIIAVTWLYFKNINSVTQSSEKIFLMIPDDASLIFEYKNEDSYYEMFKDFDLYKELLGNQHYDHLKALEQIFVKDLSSFAAIKESSIFLSIHAAKNNKTSLLMVSTLAKEFKDAENLIKHLQSKYKITSSKLDKTVVYQIEFSNKSKFQFFFNRDILIGSFDSNLLKKSINLMNNNAAKRELQIDFKSPRLKRSLSNLYINFNKVTDLLNNFSSKKNPQESFYLKNIKATAALNLNYKNNAFMFSGVTMPDVKAQNYFNLFLTQQPGKNTLINIMPYDVSNYSFYYVSNYQKFNTDLRELHNYKKEWSKLEKQLNYITSKHAINLDKELIPVLGKEFGSFQLASGDKLGVVKSSNTNRLSFLLSTISSTVTEDIRHLDDSYLMQTYFGDALKEFKRPYYAIIENHLIVANNTSALTRFLNNYSKQNFLSRTDKNLNFQQYLSNQGNIFYFIHNSNSKAVIRSFLSKPAYQDYRSKNFNWTDIYGFAIQFSADKDKYFTNLYMNKMPKEENLLPSIDSLINNTN
jgi:hypothetical protein